MSPDLDSARALHDEVCAVDLHADTPKLMEKAGFDISLRHAPMPRGAFVRHVDLPRMREGGLAAQFFGLWTFPKPERGCAASVHRQLDALDRAAAAHPDQLARCTGFDEVLAARKAGRIAALAGIEGAQALEGNVDNVQVFARRGVRYLGLLHFSANALGAPAFGWGRDDAQGLTAFGKQVVEACNAAGVIVDLAHLNRKGFFDALEVSKTPPIVSHTGLAGVHAHWRNIDDAQLEAVAERGGVIGVIFHPHYLGAATLDAVCDHLQHIIKVVGEDAPALGSDFDGLITPPRGLEDVAALPNLTAALLGRGLSRGTVKKLLGENALRVLRDVPPSRTSAS
jgi:membrane dipeptidase